MSFLRNLFGLRTKEEREADRKAEKAELRRKSESYVIETHYLDRDDNKHIARTKELYDEHFCDWKISAKHYAAYKGEQFLRDGAWVDGALIPPSRILEIKIVCTKQAGEEPK